MLIQFSRKSNQCCCTFRAFGPVLTQFSRKMDQCCCSFRTWGGQCCCIFRTCENCNNTGPPSVVAIFARAKNATTLAPPCAKTATTLVHFARKLRQHWWTSLVAVFARAKIAATLVDQCGCSFRTTRVCAKIAKHWWTSLVAVFAQILRENCDNTGGPVLSQFSRKPGFARKLQQHWWTSLAAVFAQPGFA